MEVKFSDAAHEQRPDCQIECAPKYVNRWRGLSLAERGSKGRWEPTPGHAVREVRDRGHEKNALQRCPSEIVKLASPSPQVAAGVEPSATMISPSTTFAGKEATPKCGVPAKHPLVTSNFIPCTGQVTILPSSFPIPSEPPA